MGRHGYGGDLFRSRARIHTILLQGPTAVGSFTNVLFRDCRWSPNGGAVSQTGGASSTLSGNLTVVDSCRATGLGGGIYADGGSVTIKKYVLPCVRCV